MFKFDVLKNGFGAGMVMRARSFCIVPSCCSCACGPPLFFPRTLSALHSPTRAHEALSRLQSLSHALSHSKVHFMNIFIAMQFAGKEDPCPWYS